MAADVNESVGLDKICSAIMWTSSLVIARVLFMTSSNLLCASLMAF